MRMKYQYVSLVVCAYAHALRKRPGCALIGACVLIRMSTVNVKEKSVLIVSIQVEHRGLCNYRTWLKH